MTECSTSTNNYLELLKTRPMIGAPLAGVSTPAFRRIVRLFFDGLLFTEMVSVEGLIRKGSGTMVFLRTNENDMPLGVQLFGSKSESYGDAVKVVLETMAPAVIDINMGCPVKKVIKTWSGAAMMKDEENIAKVVRAAKSACGSVPLSIKIRLGWDANSVNYNEVIKIAYEEGADAVTLHGRTKAEMFGGQVHYDLIADAKSRAKLPVIGNGDIVCCETHKRMLETGVDGVMIGRGMMKQPWIFQAINDGKATDGYLTLPRLKDVITRIIELEQENARGSRYIDASKKYIVWMLKGLPGAAALRSSVYECTDRAQLDDLLERFFLSISDTQTDRS
ncbi:tRNA dihydrouridine synthase [Seleniivibrio woodruffii]|uniref:tRNA-dihydrouridine synthase n=1 Tax=Seleniivibrio woodruffii TaxID=1078050 RepID=A0A4R1KCZ2_9BACT|nr:tRNA-dihydrouridine synthase [Seleniivibrio woodruffii]TCK61059.1 tRNA-U20-dihydrouridine synthase [Seleniivibrio woodruffii]TVZ36687.1 nifR3 family TIM-barrel protein [Seleniivibrio woodruffii]